MHLCVRVVCLSQTLTTAACVLRSPLPKCSRGLESCRPLITVRDCGRHGGDVATGHTPTPSHFPANLRLGGGGGGGGAGSGGGSGAG